MNRRELLTKVAAILPLGLVSEGASATQTPSVPEDGRGIWGVINAVCDGLSILRVTKEVCINDFARRAFQFHPSLSTATGGWIGVHIGTKEECLEAYEQSRLQPIRFIPFFCRVPDLTWVRPSSVARYNLVANKDGWHLTTLGIDGITVDIPATF